MISFLIIIKRCRIFVGSSLLLVRWYQWCYGAASKLDYGTVTLDICIGMGEILWRIFINRLDFTFLFLVFFSVYYDALAHNRRFSVKCDCKWLSPFIHFLKLEGLVPCEAICSSLRSFAMRDLWLISFGDATVRRINLNCGTVLCVGKRVFW